MCAFRKPDQISTQQQQLHNSLKEIQELKELCCYLHDERAKLINLVSEWKKFGKHIFGTMQVQKEIYKKEITDLELHEQYLVNELQYMKENIGNKGNFSGSGNIDLESVRKGGDGSSSSSPTNIPSNKNEFKKNDIYMNPKDALPSASLDSYKHLPKYIPSSTYLTSNEYTGHNDSSKNASLNMINAYDIKKFHHSMPRQRLPSNSSLRSSYGSDNVSLGLRTTSDNIATNKLHYTTHLNEIQYQSIDPKYQPSYIDDKYQPGFVNPKYQPSIVNDPQYQQNIKYQTQLSNSAKNSSNQLSDDERAMYRSMCKSVWQNLGKSTTYKTAV